jgi:hypothetical protein
MITTLENNVRYYNRKQDDKFYVDPELKLLKERKYHNEKEGHKHYLLLGAGNS